MPHLRSLRTSQRSRSPRRLMPMILAESSMGCISPPGHAVTATSLKFMIRREQMRRRISEFLLGDCITCMVPLKPVQSEV